MNKTPLRLSNQEYLDGLQKRDGATINHIYQDLFPGILKYVIESGGQRVDAEDVFQEGLIILYRKINQLELTSSFNTFLFAVCKRVWWKKRDKKIPVLETDEKQEASEEDALEAIEQNEQYTLYKEKFKLLGQDCQKLLKHFFGGLKMEKIAEEMGYGSVSYAKKRKFVCKEKLANLIKKDSRYKELKG